MDLSEKLVLALPKGRILDEVMPLVRKAGIEPEADFDNPKSRKLEFDTNINNLAVCHSRCRSGKRKKTPKNGHTFGLLQNTQT